MPKPRMAYAAICKCGGVVAATMDVPEHKRDVAKTVAEWIRDELAVERISSGSVRERWGCKCNQQTSFVVEDVDADK